MSPNAWWINAVNHSSNLTAENRCIAQGKATVIRKFAQTKVLQYSRPAHKAFSLYSPYFDSLNADINCKIWILLPKCHLFVKCFLKN